MAASLILKSIDASILFYFIYYEVTTARLQGKAYFQDSWNFLDWLIPVTFTFFVICDVHAYFYLELEYVDTTAKILRIVFTF